MPDDGLYQAENVAAQINWKFTLIVYGVLWNLYLRVAWVKYTVKQTAVLRIQDADIVTQQHCLLPRFFYSHVRLPDSWHHNKNRQIILLNFAYTLMTHFPWHIDFYTTNLQIQCNVFKLDEFHRCQQWTWYWAKIWKITTVQLKLFNLRSTSNELCWALYCKITF